jgi:hypothetical protein
VLWVIDAGTGTTGIDEKVLHRYFQIYINITCSLQGMQGTLEIALGEDRDQSHHVYGIGLSFCSGVKLFLFALFVQEASECGEAGIQGEK